VGFVEAKQLHVGDKLLDSKGNVLVVEDKKIKITDKPIKVYNFQVADFHTYHVGNNGVLVHNVKYTYKNGIYNDADYHGKNHTKHLGGSKHKSHRPQDGQFALDNSIEIVEGNTSRRVGIDINGDFVVLDETSPGVYHGHVRTWSQVDPNFQPLTEPMKKSLEKAGYVRRIGSKKAKLTDMVLDIIRKVSESK